MPNEAPPVDVLSAEPPEAPMISGLSHEEQSKSVFKQARVAAGLDQPAPPVQRPSRGEQIKQARIAAGLDQPPPPLSHEEQSLAIFKKARIDAGLDQPASPEFKNANRSTNPSEIEELRKAKEAAEDKARAIEEEWSQKSLASSPKFQAKFAGREQTALELAKSCLDGTEINQDIVDLAAHATGRERLEMLKDAGVDDAIIQLVSPHLATFDTVQREKQSALANWKTETQQWQEEARHEDEKARAVRAEEENRVWDSVLAKTDLLPLRISKDNADWNNRGDQLIADAKQLFNGEGADLPTFAETILKGKAYDAQQEIVEHLKSENVNLRTENAKLKSSAPGGFIITGTNDGQAPDMSKMSREQISKLTFNQEMTKARA